MRNLHFIFLAIFLSSCQSNTESGEMRNLYFIFLAMAIFLSSCQSNTKSGEWSQDYREGSQDYHFSQDTILCLEEECQAFQKYGFTIKAPCLLEDVSQQTSGEYLLNYGGITDKKDSSKITFYQLIVNELSIKHENISADELRSLTDNMIKSKMANFQNCKPILVEQKRYHGYVGECTTKGYTQKGVMFLKDNYIICLTVMSNDNLEKKFNKFVNSFETIEVEKSQEVERQTKLQILLDIGYSISVPCELKQSDLQDYDYCYLGAINGEDKERAIVYKFMVNKLPIYYSTMNLSDKKTIEQNIINYLQSKKNYNQWSAPIACHLSYISYSIEQGFNIKEAFILTEESILELVVFSKRNINSEFEEYINSIRLIE